MSGVVRGRKFLIQRNFLLLDWHGLIPGMLFGNHKDKIYHKMASTFILLKCPRRYNKHEKLSGRRRICVTDILIMNIGNM